MSENINREAFTQFGLVSISLEVAIALAGSFPRLLEITRDAGGFNKEILTLSTGAKLYWVAQSERSFGEKALYSFAIASYHYDGEDGWKAYQEGLAATYGMSTVSYARRTNKCAECGAWFNHGFIADRWETLYTVDLIYVCSVKCGLDSRQPF